MRGHTWFLRVALTAVMIAAGTSAGADEKVTSEWVHPGPDGKLVYQTTPAGDRIMDFSYAGYLGGGVALPEVPVKLTVQPVEGDSTAVIQEAIDKVSALDVGAKDFSPLRGPPGSRTCRHPRSDRIACHRWPRASR